MRIFAINVVLVIFIANKTVVAKLFEKCTKESAEQGKWLISDRKVK